MIRHRSPMIRLLSQRALRLILGLLVLIEAIFIADTFTSTLEGVIRLGGTAFDLLRVLILGSPEVIAFALPIVLFLGLYFAVTQARDANELVICAAASEPWQRIPRLALTLGTLGFALSLLISGLITPLSNYALRLTYGELQARLLVEQLTSPAREAVLREFDGRAVIATPPSDPETAPEAARGGLFVFRPGGGGRWTASIADNWSVEGPDDNGVFRIRLEDFREYRGRAGAAPTAETGPRISSQLPSALQFAQINVENFEIDFTVEDILAARDQVRAFGERYLFDEDGPLAGPERVLSDGRTVAAPTRAFGEMLARALLCLVAASVALAAAVWSGTRQGRFAALPAGLIAVLACDVAARAILGEAAALGYPRFWPAAAAIAALGMAPALGYVWTRGELIVAPPRSTR
ncbi:LptF/LptG family permease [Psychromarinibacter sp. C21-152]|uniref:LptF/LptG family permease n=1 Tax=Psychromarinibacter sediminicola TaxID=3033385 RepID=A0AAE3NSA9_9RHOB|nr:LptF/LptG family permease [Psychromarinibacter sediminicola]MDF0600030.1 LptF/LptG family permease [Psychromarinibacter sediminicola]